ncbi:MAG: hypothetical protein Q4B17_12235 [Lautropia sp.]|nr:hypothetical protein [Lautropia sp.]
MVKDPGHHVPGFDEVKAMTRWRHRGLMAVTVLTLLSACGGGSGDSKADEPLQKTPDTGSTTGTTAALANEQARFKGKRQLSILKHSPVSASAVAEVPAILHFEPEEGKLALKLEEDLDGNGRLNLSVRGQTDDHGGWEGKDEPRPGEGITLRISPTGQIEGQVQDAQLHMDISGRMSATRAFLRIQIDAAPGAPAHLAGMRHVHRYELERDTGKARTDEQRGTDGHCQRIRWKLKPRLNWQTGLIDTIRVPVCERQ